MAPSAVTKTLAHVLKHHRNDCVGLLLGSGLSTGQVEINDVVPLFHDRVMTSAVETAFEMVEAFYEGRSDRKIIGVYDAPVRPSAQDDAKVKCSSLALSLAEQLKQAGDTLDSIVVHVTVPAGSAEDQTDDRVREITEQEAENLHPVLLTGYAVQSTTMAKKVTL